MNELQIYDSNSLGDLAFVEVDRLTPDYYVEHFQEFLPQYISHGNPSADTLTNYIHEIKNFLGWCIGHRAHPLALKNTHCRIYLKYMIEKNYSPASLKLKISAARIFYKVAVKLELINENPFEEIRTKSPETDDTKFKFLTEEQIKLVGKKILDEPNEIFRKRNLAIFMLMTVEGLRNVEVHRMNDEDINFEMNSIYIRGKGHNDFIYPCVDTIKAIREYLEVRPDVKKDGALTPTFISLSNFNRGNRISRNSLRLTINQILKLCDLKTKGASCHMLRHSCGTNLYRVTKDLRLVQETLRQKSPTITARYAHVYDRMNNRQTEKISPFSDLHKT